MTMNTPLQFKIEQVALHPTDPERAIALLSKMGLSEWARDHVVATGRVNHSGCTNEADLAFNYQATRGLPSEKDEIFLSHSEIKPLELEVLHYTEGRNWMQLHDDSVSHLGMHCSAEELLRWRAFFESEGIQEAQSVRTISHTNPYLVGNGRKYNYTIFDTRAILGVDVKFIVRIEK